MGTKQFNVDIDKELEKEFFEKLEKATTDEEKGAIENEYLKKVYKEIK